jgi:F-type H+-transporting ATPase subunit gamma
MANLKEIRRRMNTVRTTRQVTSAMKMVSAAKLRKAQESIIKIRPYANKLFEILSSLTESLQSQDDNPYAVDRGFDKVLIVIINSNRGLCGAFNANINRRAFQLIQEEFSEAYRNQTLELMAIGKSAFDYFRKRGFELRHHNELYSNLNFERVSPIVEQIMKDFTEGKYHKVYLVYNEFKNAASQIVMTEQFLPVLPIEKETKERTANYIFEPSKDEIVKDLIPRSLKVQFYKALLDSHAAEHGARMTAMHKATDNATDLLRALNLQYNKARQAAITGEILEIVGGAEALKG